MENTEQSTRRQPGVVRFFASIGAFFVEAVRAFAQGDVWVKLSALLWGTSCLARRQFLKGILLIAEQALILWAFFGLLWPYLLKFGTLGTVEAEQYYDAVTRRNVWNNYDNSFLILLFSVLAIVLAVIAVQKMRK